MAVPEAYTARSVGSCKSSPDFRLQEGIDPVPVAGYRDCNDLLGHLLTNLAGIQLMNAVYTMPHSSVGYQQGIQLMNAVYTMPRHQHGKQIPETRQRSPG